MMYRYFEDKNDWKGGWRFVVLIHEGRKWIRFIDVSTFETYRRCVDELPRLKPTTYSPRKIAARMVKRRALFKRCGVHFSKNAVKRAIEILWEAGS